MRFLNLFITYLLIFIFILSIFTYPAIIHPNKYIYGPIYKTDNRGKIRDFWFMKYSFLGKIDFYNNNFINFPFGGRIKDLTLLPFWMTPAFFLSIWVNEIFAYNFLLFSSFVLAFIGMYLLAFYITRSHFSSFVAGLLYSLCPYHFNKAWEHYNLAFIEFFPFVFLYLFKLRQNSSFKNIIIAALFIFLACVSDLSYAYIMCVFLFSYFIYILICNIKNKHPAQETVFFIKVFLKLSIVVLILSFPFLWPVFKQMFFTPKDNLVMKEVFIRPIKYLFSQSARPLSYLIPASAHPIFGRFTELFFGNFLYGRNSIEHTLYLGWTNIILVFFLIKRWLKTKKLAVFNEQENFYISFFILMAIISFLFSMPPF